MDVNKLFRVTCLLLVCGKAWIPRACGGLLGPQHEEQSLTTGPDIAQIFS